VKYRLWRFELDGRPRSHTHPDGLPGARIAANEDAKITKLAIGGVGVCCALTASYGR